MNEVTKIHLGRTAFTISVDAHRELRSYLDAIKLRVHDEDVINEVELRMAELLAERGVHGDQVILPADVDFLKEQLGNPKDFADSETDDTEPDTQTAKQTEPKRLFRDTDNAMLAGVAAGLANYVGIDPIIVRVAFIIATFGAGWGILVYIVLWLLVPEAKTPSDRLQMAGKSVTVDSLKEIVERADLKGAAKRANRSLAGPITTVLKVIAKIIGVCFVIVGIGLLLGLATGVTYVLLHSGFQAQDTVFPVGLKEHMAMYAGAAVAAILSLFVVLLGLDIYRQKWPIRAWMTGVLVGLVLIGVAVGGALTADVAPQVRDRYNANIHTTVHTVHPFTSVDLSGVGSEVRDIEYQTSSTYSVSLRYYGRPDLAPIKTDVTNGVLKINTRGFDNDRHCADLCIPNNYDLIIMINSPTPPEDNGSNVFAAPVPSEPTQPSLN